MSNAFLKALALGMGLACVGPTAGLAIEAEQSLLRDLAACIDGGSPRIVVAGLPRQQTTLTASEAEQLRLDVEARLASQGAEIAVARDINRLRAVLEGGRTLDANTTEELIAAANAGEALIFIVEPVRLEGRVKYRLQAITKEADCKVTSNIIETALADSGSQSADRVIQAALDAFFRAAPETEALGVCPVVSDAGYSACAPAITNSLSTAALAEAGRANRTLTDRELTVSRLDQAACTAVPPIPTTVTRLSTDAAGDTWLDIQVRLRDRIVAAHPKTRVDLGALGCDPVPRPLTEFITLTANRDTQLLDITARPFATGQVLDVRVDLGANAPLYCWVIAPDETAFILLPLGDMTDWPAGAYSYPGDFGLQPVLLSEPFENLFHCFAPTATLAPDVAETWRNAALDGGQPKLLGSVEITSLLDLMRAQPGVVEAATRLIVR